MKPVIYLAGSIRDGVQEDIDWREHAIQRLRDVAYVISPLAGKTYNPETGKWSLYDMEHPDAGYIVAADFWSVDRADLILFDFRSLAEGYPSIGTLTEFGRSTARSILRFAIISEGYRGHDNLRHFPGLHPFLERNCAKVFQGVRPAVDFARRYCLSVGQEPNYWRLTVPMTTENRDILPDTEGSTRG